MKKYRIFLFVGAGLVLASMPLVAFDINWFGETEQWSGGLVWFMPMSVLFSSGLELHPITLAHLVVAAFNIPQLVIPFLRNPERGASNLWIWSFSVAGFVIVPTLASIIDLGQKNGS